MRTLATIALLALGLAACSELVAPRKAARLEPTVSGVVRAALVSADPLATEQVVRLKIQDGVGLGAYQGRLRFDPSKLQLLDYSVPEDGVRLLNTERAASGEIRFAGFAPTGFGQEDAAGLRFRVLDATGLAELQVLLEVGGNIEAVPVPRAQLHGLRGVYPEALEQEVIR